MKAILETQKKDWKYIILAPVYGFLTLAIYLLLLNSFETLFSPSSLAYILFFVLYSVVFDVNHYFSTYYRVFVDRNYYKKNKKWMYPGLIFITIVPLLVFGLTSYTNFAYNGYYFFLFFRKFVLILGFYHLVQQNWGFMAMYKGQAKERKTKINWDKWTLLSGSFIPLIILNMMSPVWFVGSEEYIFNPQPHLKSSVIEWWNQMALLNVFFFVFLGTVAIVFKRFQYRLPARNMAFFCLFVGLLIFSILKWGASPVLTTLLGFVIGVFIVSLFQSIRFQIREGTINWKKWAVLISTLILYFGVILYPVGADKLIVIAAITLPHNIQYLAFVPSFSKKEFTRSEKDHGLAKKLSKKLVLLFLIGVVFSMVFEFGRTGLSHILPDSLNFVKIIISVFFIVLILHHYYLDAVIWKFSKSKDLKETRDS